MEDYRNLILRSSRNLGSKLIELGLIDESQLETAYQKLLEAMKIGDIKQTCLLKFLMYEVEAISEPILLDKSQYPLINLDGYEVQDPKELGIDVNDCWATWTVVFDSEEDFFFIATAYNLSEPVIKYWEEKLDGKIIWYTTNLRSIASALQNFTEDKPKETLASNTTSSA